MDRANIRAIEEWELSTKVSELHSFLELTNYYRWFIQGTPVSPLHRRTSEEGMPMGVECQVAFDHLKRAYGGAYSCSSGLLEGVRGGNRHLGLHYWWCAYVVRTLGNLQVKEA